MTWLTYAEAKAQGWTKGDAVWQKGYVSRKAKDEYIMVEEAGGTRRGQYYVLLPNRESTRYCIRQYLIPPTKEEK